MSDSRYLTSQLGGHKRWVALVDVSATITNDGAANAR